MSAFLSLIAGLTEGISLVLLIPIVAAAASDPSGQMAGLPLIGDYLSLLKLELTILLTIFLAVIALQAIFTRMTNIYNNRIMHKATDAIRLRLFENISMAHWGAISTRRTSDINHVLSNDTDRMVLAASAGLGLFQAAIMLLIYMMLAAAVSWQMALFAVIVGSLLFGALYPIRRRATAHGKEMTEKLQNKNHVVLEFISSIRLAKLFTAERDHSEAYSRHLESIRRQVVDFMALTTMGTLLFQVGAAIIAVVFVWLSIKVFALDIARIGVLLVIFARLAPRFNMIQNSTQQFLANAPAFTNYRSMTEFFVTNRETDPLIQQTPPRLTRSIAIESISVEFQDAAAPSLDNITLNIRAGKITALIGQSGCGKSTLADILLGLTRGDSGSLLVDGTPITEENRRAWRSSVASVPQDAFLLNDTIAANLRISNADADDDALWQCLDRANIGDLIRSLPDGLDTMTGDRGMRFSGGERQRLALARALLRQPQLLVLDEATSALDWENQNIIAKAIEALRDELTILTIAHRPSLITFADDVIALAKGKVIAQASYDDMKRDPSSPLSQMLIGEKMSNSTPDSSRS